MDISDEIGYTLEGDEFSNNTDIFNNNWSIAENILANMLGTLHIDNHNPSSAIPSTSTGITDDDLPYGNECYTLHNKKSSCVSYYSDENRPPRTERKRRKSRITKHIEWKKRRTGGTCTEQRRRRRKTRLDYENRRRRSLSGSDSATSIDTESTRTNTKDIVSTQLTHFSLIYPRGNLPSSPARSCMKTQNILRPKRRVDFKLPYVAEQIRLDCDFNDPSVPQNYQLMDNFFPSPESKTSDS